MSGLKAAQQPLNRAHSMIIGIDLDNTIIDYDQAFRKHALEMGLLSDESLQTKKQIRDHIRELEDGDLKWQDLQARVYGPCISDAQLMAGADTFLQLCSKMEIPTFIVSHKTQFAHRDKDGMDLRDAATHWLNDHGFFSTTGMSVGRDRIFFESERAAKIRRIRKVRCTHFIDDLEETFLEPSFPGNVRKMLLCRTGLHQVRDDIDVFGDWFELTNSLFDVRN